MELTQEQIYELLMTVNRGIDIFVWDAWQTSQIQLDAKSPLPPSAEAMAFAKVFWSNAPKLDSEKSLVAAYRNHNPSQPLGPEVYQLVQEIYDEYFGYREPAPA